MTTTAPRIFIGLAPSYDGQPPYLGVRQTPGHGITLRHFRTPGEALGMLSPTSILPEAWGEPTQEELRAALIRRAAEKGFRPAEPWEIELLSPEHLYTADCGGPVFVRAR